MILLVVLSANYLNLSSTDLYGQRAKVFAAIAPYATLSIMIVSRNLGSVLHLLDSICFAQKPWAVSYICWS